MQATQPSGDASENDDRDVVASHATVPLDGGTLDRDRHRGRARPVAGFKHADKSLIVHGAVGRPASMTPSVTNTRASARSSVTVTSCASMDARTPRCDPASPTAVR